MKRKKLLISLIAFSLIGIVSCDSSNSNKNSNQGSENSTSQTADDSSIKYTVTYYLNDGSDKVYHQEMVPAGGYITRPENPSIEGLRFRGWYVDPECLVIFSTDTSADLRIKADTNLYAKWIVDTSDNPSSSSANSSLSSETSSGSTSSSLGSSTDIPEGTTYTINGLPDWITNDGCVIFAWVWGPEVEGEWVATTYATDKTSLTFTTDKTLDGFLLARCIQGTTEPNWDIKDNVPGKVYNKTNDVKVTAGVTTYTIPDGNWPEC